MYNTEFTAFDLETLSADKLFTSDKGSFVRLVGLGEHVTTVDNIPDATFTGVPLVGHNNFFFDSIALARHHDIPLSRTVWDGRDLRVAAFQNDPPTSYQTTPGPGFKSYSLDALGERYLGVAKSVSGKALAKEFGGWDHIPVDDPRYVLYCGDDVQLTEALDKAIPLDPYEIREAKVCTITAVATLKGFRVDVDGLQKRADELAAKSAAGRTMLAEVYGFPTLNAKKEPAAAPQRSKLGKAAFETALEAGGFPIASWPRSKDGSLSLDKETMAFALSHAERKVPAAADVIRAVSEMNGVRNNAANVLRYTVGDRVHPAFLPFQATGRWSILEPGLTVLKKGVPDSERYFLLPDDDDEVLVSIDLDQIDIRCVAAHSQDHNLIDILNDPTRDIHQEVADLAMVGRHPAKSLDLGWLYGRTVGGLAKTPGITFENAVAVDASMRQQFGQVMQWQRHVRELGEAGVLLDNGFGRNLRVDPERAFTQAPGFVGQSTTRDLIAEGLLDLAKRAPEVIPMLRVIVHDEVVASVPRKHATEIATIIQSCMSREWAPVGKDRPVRISAGQGKPFVFGETWGSLYE
jgi:DNA polymerase-1